jgi:alkylation response protein AidB-like acyl-CoA dehydrogenase
MECILLDEDLDGFRMEVKAFAERNIPADVKQRSMRGLHVTREDQQLWNKVLADKRWAAPHWPIEYGGTGWSPLKRMAFEIEVACAEAPTLSPFGLYLIGPVIYTFGSEWQKQRYLPGIRDGSEVWCQGYSEPNAGSDLASLRTAAIRKGDRYVVNGQKMWTGEGHFADMIFCLVRTDTSVPKQSGISMILINMKSPGVTVKPIITMDMGHNVNEVFFEDVEVPLENLIGDEGKGWTYAKFLLENERTYSAYLPESKRDLLRLKKYIERGAPMLREDERFDTEVAQLEIDLAAHEAMIYRILLGNLTVNPAGAASMIKIRGAEIRQRLANMWVEALGPQTLLLPPDHDHADDVAGAMGQALFRRSVSIYGGANEIQHGIIAKRGLGL